jgi:sterol desaturase/sphingolipid hydroxylase (fatty acid hydroxylase superfamily)
MESAAASSRARSAALRASPPLTGSRLVDRSLRVRPRVAIATFGPVIAILLALALARMGALETLAWAVGGYALWTLNEYWLHRVVLHFEPENRLGAYLHWMFHGAHHDHPNNPEFVVAPPIVSVPLAAAFGALFCLVLGAPAWLGFFAGFIAGYLIYDVTHYRLHQRRPRTRLGRLLREQHMRHHFQDGTRSFGVTAPYWDRVFGTAGVRRRGLRASGARARDGEA